MYGVGFEFHLLAWPPLDLTSSSATGQSNGSRHRVSVIIELKIRWGGSRLLLSKGKRGLIKDDMVRYNDTI
jgi:hypothetical protein